ncbi:MAG: Hsp20/alpha crystallin family protein [Bacteroidia bacterium]
MTLLKLRPTRELLRDSVIPSQMMNLFDEFFNDSIGKFERNVFFTPRVDVAENAKQFEIHVSLPGLKKEEVKLDVDGEMLTISGERKFKNEDKENKYHLVENFYGYFSRSFNLPENIDKTNISAELNDGILNVKLPKTEVKENKTSIKIS